MTQTDGLRPQLRLILAESYRKRPGRVSAISALTVASALVEGVSLVLLVPILQTLTGDGTVTVDLAGQRVTLALGTMLIAFVLLIVLRVAFQRYCAVTTSRLRMEMVDDLRLDALGALLNARWSYFLGRRSGDLLHTIHTDANRAGLAVDRASALAGNLAMVLVLAGVALFVSPALAAVSIVITLVAMAMALPLVRASHRIGARMGQSGRDLSSETVNALDSMRLIRAHDAADAWLTSLSDRTADVRRAAIANQHRSALTGGVLQVASAVGAAVVIGVGYINGAGVETLLVLVLVMARMLASAGSMTREFQMLAASAPALAMILGLTEDARAHSDGEEPSTRSGADPVIDLRTPPADFDGGGPPRIEVQDVYFTYPNATDPSLTNLSLDVAPGQVTALAGHSGAGKSTTVDLVLGLLRPDEGRISVNGVNLNRIDLKRWRDTIAYVPQDPTLMDDTLRRNLRIGLPNHADGSDAACLAALAAAGAGPSFLARLTDGLDTEIGDRGVRLSGGERQRVALARALLRRPTLLVLDEATSALDDATEAVVHERVRALRGHCTVLVVAHRASTLAIADTIFTLESGALRKSRTTGTSTR